MAQFVDSSEIEAFSLKPLFSPFTNAKALIWITIIGFIIYSNIFFNGFVLDDMAYIVNNSQIHSFNILYLFGHNLFNSDSYYRPLSATFYSLLWNIFQSNPFGYHLVQILLHIIGTMLLYLFLKKFFSSVLSFFLSLVFLVHPIQVESVVYIASMECEFLFIPGMIALLISTREKLNSRSLLLMALNLLICILTKEVGFLFLFLILFYQYLFYRKRLLTIFLYVLLPVAIYLILRLAYAQVFLIHTIINPLALLPLPQRITNISAVFFYYLKTFIFPAQLAVDQRWIISAIDLQQFYIPLFASFLFLFLIWLGGLTVVRQDKKQLPLYLFFTVWFFVGIGLLLQIFPLDSTVADRWFYFPIIGLLGIVGILYKLLQARRRLITKASIIIAVAILFLLSIRTMIRNTNWQNAFILYSHDSAISTNYNLEDLLGTQYFYNNNIQEAKIHLQKSVALYPYQENLYHLGYIYELQNNYKIAEYYYYQSLTSKIKVDNGNSLDLLGCTRLGALLLYEHQYNSAKVLMKEALTEFPNNVTFWLYLAISEYQTNDQKDALTAAKNANMLVTNNYAADIYQRIQHNEPLDLNHQSLEKINFNY